MYNSEWNHELIVYLKSLGLDRIPIIDKSFPAIFVSKFHFLYRFKYGYEITIMDKLNWLEITIIKDKHHYYRRVRNMLE